MQSGEGWTECALGHRHWGRHGAAGLLVVAPPVPGAGGPWVLLQHRAPWSHDGDTWGVPGGARHRDESAEQGALRETAEETGLDVDRLELVDRHVADHGGWSYTTLVARAPERLPTVADHESVEVRWVTLGEVERLPLHGGFAASWESLRARLP